jgi:hypothetical protein
MGRSADQDLIDWLADKIQGPGAEAAETNGRVIQSSESGPVPTDEMVIEKCRAAQNAAKFSDLFDYGDPHLYHRGDDSAADLALLSILSFGHRMRRS